MEVSRLIAAIDEEIARLTQARALLAGTKSTTFNRRPEKRRFSAEARQRISDAQKRRWAALKKAKK